MPRRLIAFIAIFALAFAIVGCSSGSTSASSSSASSKASSPAEASASSKSNLQAVSTSSSSAENSTASSSSGAAEPLALIADNHVCKIVVTGVRVDSKDGPGYDINFTNNGKQKVDIGAVPGSFTVNGQECQSYMSYIDIAPGTTKKVFLHFGKTELDASVDALTNVHGKLEVIDSNSMDTQGEYAFDM